MSNTSNRPVLAWSIRLAIEHNTTLCPKSSHATIPKTPRNASLLARIYAARGIRDVTQLDTGLGNLLPFTQLKNAQEMARILADAIGQQRKLLIVADYDADGATVCAVGQESLEVQGWSMSDIVQVRVFAVGGPMDPTLMASIVVIRNILALRAIPPSQYAPMWKLPAWSSMAGWSKLKFALPGYRSKRFEVAGSFASIRCLQLVKKYGGDRHDPSVFVCIN